MLILNDILIGITSNILTDVIKNIYNYFGLSDYVKFKFKEFIDPESITKINSYSKNQKISGNQIFWNKIYTKELKIGSYVRLLDFQLSPWFPRRPGVYWTDYAKKARLEAFNKRIAKKENGIIIFDVYGKTLMVELGGIGCVNFDKNRNQVLATATSSGITDEGIPILIRKNDWDKIQNEYQENQNFEVDLDGVISRISPELDVNMLRGTDKIVFEVKSILNVKNKFSDTPIQISPWTIFETNNKEKPYGFTYLTHNLNIDKIEDSVNWIKNYVNDNKGNLIITDFDECKNYLNAEFPLNSVMNNIIDQKIMLKYFQDLKNKF